MELIEVLAEQEDHILEGLLRCPDASCQHEYPILDGIPLLLTHLPTYIAANIEAIRQRRPYSDLVESVISDCCGPESYHGHARQQISSYAWDHYGDLDDGLNGQPGNPGSPVRLVQKALESITPNSGPFLEVGCAVGRGCLELAQHTNQLVLGVDTNFPMLRLAGETLRNGRVSYQLREVGLVYGRREFQAQFPNSGQVDFWACDAAALPFAPALFRGACGFNILDSIENPAGLIQSMQASLAPGARAVFTCPYDWSTAVTPLENWIGGHSQRGPNQGASEAVLKELVAHFSRQSSGGLQMVHEEDNLEWHVRLHRRSLMTYRLHLFVLEKQFSATP